MATKAKNTAAKAETKTAKVEEAKVEVKEEVKAEPAKKATTAKKTATKSTTKTEEKKTVAKTEEKAEEKKTVKKTTKKDVEMKSEFFVQFSGYSFSYDDLLEKVKADYIAQAGEETISSIKLYFNIDDKKVYYDVNEGFLGNIYVG